MKIGHISDLHWLDLSGARIRDFFNKRLTGGFNLVAGRAKKHTKQAVIDALDAMRASGVDHLVVTGDLTNLALPSEFKAVMDTIDGYFDAAHRTIVPGNHDFYTRESARCDRFCHYVYGDDRSAQGDCILCGNSPWPFAQIRDDVCFIALNSAQPRPWFVAAGRLGTHQCDDLATLLARREITSCYKIALLHHHIVRVVKAPGESLRCLDDRKQFLDICQNGGVDLVLHGHNHDFSQFKVGNTLISEAGSCSVSHFKRDNRAGKFNIYTIEDKRLVDVATWRYEDGHYKPWRHVTPSDFKSLPIGDVP